MKKQLFKNIKGLVLAGENLPSVFSGREMSNIPIIHNAYLALENSEVVAYGPMSEWEGIVDWRDLEVIDADGKFVLPAFCDSHTHTVFAKTREEEFVERIQGLSYEEIALNGGGILNSAKKLQQMEEDLLVDLAVERVTKMIACGTGAIEIKSGYGLSVDAELKMLRVIKRLKSYFTIPIKATLLAAHAFPLEFKDNHRGYIDLIINQIIPVVQKENLADYIDVFCERNYFSPEEMEEILLAGIQAGLRPKVHVNQFSSMGGLEKAVELNALTVDHLEVLTENDVLALKSSSTLPVFLPGCSHFLSIPFGNASRLIDENIPFALASDFNPGSTPCYNLCVIWSLACIKMRLTPEQALIALTVNAAAAMELSTTHGTISLGKKPGIILTKEIPSLAYIPYSFGENLVEQVYL
jgi:imidazolonepropionase